MMERTGFIGLAALVCASACSAPSSFPSTPSYAASPPSTSSVWSSPSSSPWAPSWTSPAAKSSETTLSLGGTYWQPQPKGETFITAGSKPGTATSVDLDHDLGLDSRRQFTWRGDVAFSSQRITFEYLPLSFHGSTNVGSDFTFHGATYTSGTAISSQFDLETYILHWDSELWSERKTKSSAHAGIGAWWWRYDMQVSGGGNDERRKFSHVYPGVHGDTTWDVGNGLLATLEIAFAATGANRRLYDFSGGLTYNVSDHLDLAAGYRLMRWDFNESTNDGDFDIRGPYAGLTIRF